MTDLKHTCHKCGYKTNKYNSWYNHIYLRKFSCNKGFDNQILLLAFEKIITFETENENFEITYATDNYILSIKRNCFNNNPYFEDFFIRYNETNIKIEFYAEWCNDTQGKPRKDKMKIVK
jgi:hypothetical protein